ncbi:hypothetical protein [Kocuria sp. NPDC057446]|uniref:hypothetical protein n=1 Tax=Kocuria sp. NPDC057446 TaxID=3346137 RepID=UPI0036809136
MSRTMDPDDVVPGPARSRRATAAAATALAAVLLMGLGLSPAAADSPAHRSVGSVGAETAPLDPDVVERLAGVAQDLAEAVTHGEITEAQAAFFLAQVYRKMFC